MLALFDNAEHLNSNHKNIVLPLHANSQDFNIALKFLGYYHSCKGTFNSYRREIEKLLHWSWGIQNKSLKEINKDDIESFISFCKSPPPNWVSAKKVSRFIVKNNKRIQNPKWRPAFRSDLAYSSVNELFAILSSFFNFLVTEDYIVKNPVLAVRQKSKFIRRSQTTAIRRLTHLQIQTVMEAVDNMAIKAPGKHERTRFIITCLLDMYLRISELVASDRWVPLMNHFYQDHDGSWWFKTVGKGNKERTIAVSDTMLESLKRWRKSIGLSPLPSISDYSVLIPKLDRSAPLSDTSTVRKIVNTCFTEAIKILKERKLFNEAENLKVATVHSLRHTGISEDVKTRPIEHVRDDAGHESITTTNRYIHSLDNERYYSAKDKALSTNSVDKVVDNNLSSLIASNFNELKTVIQSLVQK